MKQKRKKNKYGEYSERTQIFMNAVEQHLSSKFGSIEAQWDGLLSMLATNYELFFNCKEIVNKEGLMVQNRFGGFEKHPLIKVMTDAQIQVIKLVAEFGISPRSIKNLNVTDNNEDDFIEALTR